MISIDMIPCASVCAIAQSTVHYLISDKINNRRFWAQPITLHSMNQLASACTGARAHRMANRQIDTTENCFSGAVFSSE